MIRPIKRTITCVAISLIVASCFFGDDPHNENLIVKDFWLSNYHDDTNTEILLSDDGISGEIVIPHSVYAIGYDNNFIIAKQHPDKEEEIRKRLFQSGRNERGGYELEDAGDTIYLASDDSIYKENGKWYHISNGWNPPDSLKPYRKVTNYHIIDLRNYKNGVLNSYQTYVTQDEKNFRKKCDSLSVPQTIMFKDINEFFGEE